MSTDAINQRDTKQMSIAEAEVVLDKFIADGWLEKNGKKLWYGIRLRLSCFVLLPQQYDLRIL